MFIRVSGEDLKVVLRDFGTVLQWSSAAYAIPVLAALLFLEPVHIMAKYALVGVFSFALGYVIKKIFASDQDTELKHALIAISVIWLVFPAIAGFPFVLIQGMNFLDSFFEAMSAITTTGLSVVPHIGNLPKSLIFWRSFLSWIGGLGIVVMALVGVFAAYTKSARFLLAEGKQERLRPNIKNMVKDLWAIYVILTVFGTLLVFLSSDLSLFHSINYSMSAISTTGMDSIEGGLVGRHNPWLDLSLMVVMILGATSFSVHYLFFKRKQVKAFFGDIEFRALLFLGALTSLIILPKMILFYGSNYIGVEYAFFHVVSALTAGGVSLVSPTEVRVWEDFIKLLLIGVMFIGGSSGSTAGGIKLSRFIIFIKSIYWRIKASVLPEDSFFARKFEGRDVEDKEIKQVTQFILLYAIFLLIGTALLTLDGTNLGTALFEVASAQGNVGISSGISQQGMPLLSETVLILNMWIGRLEIIPVLALVGFMLSRRKL